MLCVMVCIRSLVTITISDGFPISDMGLPIGLLDFGGGTTKAKQNQNAHSNIKGNSVKVPTVGQGPDQGHGIHGPIETELVRAEQEPGVGSRQVEKR